METLIDRDDTRCVRATYVSGTRVRVSLYNFSPVSPARRRDGGVEVSWWLVDEDRQVGEQNAE